MPVVSATWSLPGRVSPTRSGSPGLSGKISGASDGIYKYTPVAIAGWTCTGTALTAGTRHTCVLTSAGGIRCWGSNTVGQLGRTTLADAQPVGDVDNLTSGVTAATAGYEHTCAIVTGGGVLCCGSNASGQLGDGTTTARSTPTFIDGN